MLHTSPIPQVQLTAIFHSRQGSRVANHLPPLPVSPEKCSGGFCTLYWCPVPAFCLSVSQIRGCLWCKGNVEQPRGLPPYRPLALGIIETSIHERNFLSFLKQGEFIIAKLGATRTNHIEKFSQLKNFWVTFTFCLMIIIEKSLALCRCSSLWDFPRWEFLGDEAVRFVPYLASYWGVQKLCFATLLMSHISI